MDMDNVLFFLSFLVVYISLETRLMLHSLGDAHV